MNLNRLITGPGEESASGFFTAVRPTVTPYSRFTSTVHADPFAEAHVDKEKPQPKMRIELTPEQRKQIKEASGEDAEVLEFSPQELEDRIAPSVAL